MKAANLTSGSDEKREAAAPRHLISLINVQGKKAGAVWNPLGMYGVPLYLMRDFYKPLPLFEYAERGAGWLHYPGRYPAVILLHSTPCRSTASPGCLEKAQRRHETSCYCHMLYTPPEPLAICHNNRYLTEVTMPQVFHSLELNGAHDSLLQSQDMTQTFTVG
ncbi:hypothetical protein EOD39_22086 [Acipenser ruthenus]|uniref:Uncharacterized protein n=1 Tax=Acipenser ruthenus TaxID=7906 RepID=A0A444UQW3_ACIRT|nr:hypothetical protein EOD39_22086 [Acipenser ruthenus]